LLVPQFVFLDDLKHDLQLDLLFQEILDKCTSNSNSDLVHEFKFHDGLLLQQGKIWVSTTSTFRDLLLKKLHESLIGGHTSIHCLSTSYFP